MKKYLSLFVAILFITNISYAKETSIKTKLTNAANEYTEERFLNGVYLFSTKNKTLLKGAHGLACVEDEKKLQADEIMPIASATKTMTAACILKLQDKGLLNVKDKVSKHLGPDCGIWKDNNMPEWANELTLHHLLTHRSGLAEYFFDANPDITKPHDQINRDIANYAASKKLSMKPGEKHDYNNTNFVLLGLIIEKVSGKTLNDFFVKELFTPLGLKNTRLLTLKEAVNSQKNPSSSPEPKRYFMTPAGTKQPMINPAKAPFFMVPYADGGVVSTTEDLVKWHKAIHSGKVLSNASYKLMTKGHYDAPSKTGIKSKIGYGLYISTFENGDVAYHHAGNALAIRSESGYIPAKGLYYAALSNMMTYIPKSYKGSLSLDKKENKPDIIHFMRHMFNSIK